MTLNDIKHTNLIICSSVLVERELLLTNPFGLIPYENFEDYDLWKRLMVFSDVSYLEEPLVGYDMDHGRISNQKLLSKLNFL